MKKFTALFLALIIAVTTFVVPSSAATKKTKVWNGKADTSWYTGKKTSYDIDTPEELAGLSKLVNSGKSMEGITINLTSDLVMNDTTGWDKWVENLDPPEHDFTPIGKSGGPVKGYYPFSGIFNGNGHTINGLCVRSGETAGLFGFVYCGMVTNLILDDSVIYGYDNGKGKGVYAGGIAGILDGGIISQCETRVQVYSYGKQDMASGSREAYAGGIVGSMHTENMTAIIAGITVEAILGAGGLVANPALFNDGKGGVIKESGIYNCISHNYVQVECGTTGYVAGIAGQGNVGVIKNCISACNLIGKQAKNSFGRKRGTLKGGHILGKTTNCKMVNCYYLYRDANKNLKGIGDNWSSFTKVTDNAVCKTNKEVMTKSFAKTMGEAFVYVKNDRPYLACDLNSPAAKTTSSTNSKTTKPSVTVKNGKATVKWSAVDETESYIVYKKQSNGKYKKLIATKKTQITIKNVKDGDQYDLLIKAVYEDGAKKTIKNGKISFKA